MEADIGRKLGMMLIGRQISREEEAYRRGQAEQARRREENRAGYQAQREEYESGGISQAELLAEERAERIKMGRELPPEVPGEEE